MKTLMLFWHYRSYVKRLVALFHDLVEAERKDRMKMARRLTKGIWKMVDEVQG
jgi:hypothetical protein